MSPDRDPQYSDEEPEEEYEDDPPRSIFSAAWFRIVVVLLGIGVVGAVAVPYVLDVVNPPAAPPKTVAAPAPVPPVSAPSVPAEGAARSSAAPAPTPPTPPVTTATPTPSAPPSGPSPAAPVPAKAVPGPDNSAPAKTAPAGKPPVATAPARIAEPRVAAEPRAAPEPRSPVRARATEGGDWYVQVGAFKEQEAAKQVAARLRQQNYSVVESTKIVGGSLAPVAEAPRPAARPAPASGGPDRYDVLVSGGSSADLNVRLSSKGLASEPTGDGMRIRPSLPLRDAVALSKDLGIEGFKVQVRRAGGAGADPAPAPAPAATARPSAGSTEGQTVYRVRVGGYPDRGTAQGIMRELQEKGFQPFIAKGRE